MKKLYLLVCAVVLSLSIMGTANASLVVNFDDLSKPISFTPDGFTVSYGLVPDSYAGFNWTGWEVMGNGDVNRYPGNAIAFPSQSNAAYPGNGKNSITSGGQAFNFQGAYLASWVGGNGAGNSLTVTGYLGAQNKGTQTVSLTDQMIWTAAIIQNVDRLEFTSNGYYLLDNFTTSAVPIPGAVWLLGSGLIGLVGMRRKIKNI